MNKRIFFLISLLAMVSLACSFTVTLPTIETGEDQVFTVNEAAPDSREPFDLALKIGAANVDIAGGAAGLLEGTITYNVVDLEPEIDRTSSSLELSQGKNANLTGLNINDIKNEWMLKLGGNVPLNLSIDAGAYTGEMDFTNVPLRSVEIHDGASTNTVTFSAPNPSRMDEFSYVTGASTVELAGLANANADQVTFAGGAGTYTLDFTGNLQRDMDVKIDAGVSTIRIVLPEGIRAEVEVRGEMQNVSTRGTWTVTDNVYTTGSGNGPLVSILVNTSLGTLTLDQE